MSAFEMLPPVPLRRRTWFLVLQGGAAVLVVCVISFSLGWALTKALTAPDPSLVGLPLAQWQCTDQRSAVTNAGPITWCVQWSRR